MDGADDSVRAWGAHLQELDKESSPGTWVDGGADDENAQAVLALNRHRPSVFA